MPCSSIGTRIKTRKRNIAAPLDPAAFSDAVVQIYLDNAGDLELIARSIESSDLNFSRYGDTFFEASFLNQQKTFIVSLLISVPWVVFTGGRTQPGTTKPDEGDRHPYSIIECEPTREVILPSVIYIQKILRRRPFLIKNLENVMRRFLQSLELFEENERKKLAIFTALAFSQKLSGLPPETVFQPLLKDNLVAKGLVLSFMTDFFKEYLIDNSLDDLISILKRGKIEDNLLDFFPPTKRSNETFSEHFGKEGLVALVEYNEKKIFEVKLKEMKSALTTQITEEADTAEVIETVKLRVRDAKLPDIEVVRVLWDVLMDAVQWSGKNQQQNANSALRQVKTWAELLNTFCTSGKLELELMYKVQMQCYEDAKLMKLFPEIIRSLYDQDVLAEDTILHWFRKGTNSKGRQTFVKALEPFVNWLEEAEEEDLSVNPSSIICKCKASIPTPLDAAYIRRAAHLADKSAGFTSPHPNFGCVLVAPTGAVAGEGYLYAQGTTAAEVQAVDAAGERCCGATAYLNMEPGDCHGDHSAVSALVQGGVERVVIGMRHPLQHLRGNAVRALRNQGLLVDLLGEDLTGNLIEDAQKECLLVNAPLICRAASRVPFSVLKYAMTLDGKIAASTGHASWISSKQSRNLVFELRGRSDAVIVGGNTVRRDNPRLTARHGGGHMPMRIVMTQTLDLPEEANLWDMSEVSTIVVTQRGARRSFQKLLASKGVEVVEFDILNPREVMEYFHARGYLSILWECGGTLAASAISSGVIHKVFAFVAPKIIGGKNAPSPVGDLGMVEMSQALNLIDVCYEQVGPDMLISGFLQPLPEMVPVIPSLDETFVVDPTVSPYESRIIFFYKTWDPYGVLSNFSPHSIQMPDENGDYVTWLSVEHYYQAHKFVGVDDPLAQDCVERIKSAKSPEEAARIGRSMQRQKPDLIRSDWENIKIDVMYRALRCKFSIYPHLNSMLLSTAGSVLVEASPHDLFWGGGREGEGLNYLGRLLMKLRSEFLGESSSSSESPSLTV
ncbi:Riboflavin biosynthesis protein PYRR, chloroplastic [Mucuna pruriens]|uniref:5-amino-6-(5-phosphoribosylamino)uracil reductase n=1 Tax=Mucuna pruriens TaxID=157652 RepID=A0A371F1H8_MUCPR|nr:Riboflavin biosynthesis protein PYRR, chloroplastic [Mucuna pruriens]